MKKNEKKKTKLVAVLLILVLLISIGYAALTTNLTINGNATVKANSWNVHFTNIVVDTENNSVASVDTAPTLSENDTKVTWEVSMDTPGQVYKFNVDVKNEGSIDAMVNTATNSIVTNTLTQAQQAYLDYTITYVNGAAVEQYDKLAAGETKTLTVRLAFKQDIDPQDLPGTAQNGISLSYTANYVQADNNAVTKTTSIAHGLIVVGNDTVQRGDDVYYNPGSLTTANIELPEGAELQGAQIASVNLPSGASIDGTIDASQAATYEVATGGETLILNTWKVLDVTEEGDVLIIPTEYDTTELTLSGMNGYNNAIQALNAVSSIYVNPTYAESARSITVDDVNKIENYTPSVTEETYSWNHRYGMDQNTFDIIDYGEGNVASRTYKMTEDNDYYSYQLNESCSYLGDKSCWLASRCVGLDSDDCSFCVRRLNYGYVDYNGLFCVYGNGGTDGNYNSYSVLPVVTLKSGIHMEKVNDVWQLSE